MKNVDWKEDAESILTDCVQSIEKPDGSIEAEAARRMEGLLKPPGSLGRLEELGIRMAAIQGTIAPRADKKLSLVFAGDHGVTVEGVSASPPQVTGIMVRAFLTGKAGINVIGKQVGSTLKVVDVGVAEDYPEPDELLVRRVRRGTGNLRVEAAMSRDEALRSLAVGIVSAREAIAHTGAHMVGVGEMGIGNTTPASAMTAVFTNRDPAAVTGDGTGLGSEGVKRKTRVITDALALHRPDPEDPVGVLASVGGLEIGAMAGAMLAGAERRALVVVDGFISGAAALLAHALRPAVTEYMVLSHMSAEPGHQAVAATLDMKPLLDLGLRLGEGTGAAMAMPLVSAGASLLYGMGTLVEELIKLEAPD